MMLWLATLKGQIAVVAMALLGAWGWLKLHDAKVAARVTNDIVQRAEKEGAARAEKSSKIHDAAQRPGAFERLRRDAKTCPNCDR